MPPRRTRNGVDERIKGPDFGGVEGAQIADILSHPVKQSLVSLAVLFNGGVDRIGLSARPWLKGLVTADGQQ